MKTIFCIILVFGICWLPTSLLAQAHDALIISHELKIDVNKNKLAKKVHYEIQINNRKGEKYSTITVPYSKLIKIDNIEAFVKDSDGKTVKKLKKNDIIIRSSISDFSLYEDDFIKEFTLKHNTYPYTIVYSYEIRENEFFYISSWIPVVDSDIPTLNAKLELTIPPDYKISYKNNQVQNPQIDTLDNSLQYTWHTNYVDLIQPEVHLPHYTNLFPFVMIVPINFEYDQKGSFENWVTFGNWQYNLLNGLNDLPETEKNRIDRLIENVTDENEKIKILYHYLQDETRYINVAIETGGLKPHSAGYVAQNKYGDCKALSNYFKSVLDYCGIQSYYTKVHAGAPVLKTDKEFPSPQSNHIILFIPGENKDIWLDCTSKGPFGYLGTFTQNREAFIVDKDNSFFKKTPALSFSDVAESRNIEVSYGISNSPVRFRNTYKGAIFEQLLELKNGFNASEKLRIIKEYFVENGLELEAYNLQHNNRDSVKISLKIDAQSQNLYKKYGNDILITDLSFHLPYFENPDDRKLPG